MEDQGEFVGAAAGVGGGGVGGGAAAGGGGALGGGAAGGGGALGAAAAGGGAAARGGVPGSLCTTHSLAWLSGNRNSDAGQGKSSGKKNQILILTKKLRVADERVNFQNQKLIDTYNEIWKAGDLYLETIKGGKNKARVRNIEKNILGLLSNLKTYKAAVLEVGGEPIKFPVQVFQELPKYFQDALKEEKIA